MYSQNAEEGVINSVLPDNGRFLDVGAFDGRTFSNTLKLYERGWSGVLVEPSPLAFAGLQREYKGKPRVELIQAAVADKDGTIGLWDSGGDAISSTVDSHKAKWEKGYKCKFTKIVVPSITYKTLFDKYGDDYNFVNIDTESTNLEMLKAFPFERCNPMCMCIEHDSKIDQMMAILSIKGFRVVYTSGENIVVYRGK
jgi:FkbM family methyltransferase